MSKSSSQSVFAHDVSAQSPHLPLRRSKLQENSTIPSSKRMMTSTSMEEDKTWLDVLLEHNVQLSEFMFFTDVLLVALSCQSTFDNFKWHCHENRYVFGGISFPPRYVQDILCEPDETENKIKNRLKFFPVDKVDSCYMTDVLACGQDLDVRVNCPMNDTMVGVMTKLCPCIVTLSLVDCNAITDDALKLIGEHCPQLLTLDLSFSGNSLTGGGVEKMIKNFPKLETLKLSNTNIDILNDATMSAIASSCPELTHINISNCEDVTFSGLKALTEKCVKLKTVERRRATRIHSKATSIITPLLGSNCHDLEFLDISRTRVHDVSLQELAEGCPNLLTLIMKMCDILGCANTSMQSLAKGCTKLKRLDLSLCTSITDSTMLTIAGIANLVHLNVSGCDQITNSGVSALSSCKNLETINLTKCKVTDTGVQALASKCKKLRMFTFYLCYTLTDNAFVALSECKNLDTIIVSGCKITNMGIKTLATNCLNLKYLSVTRCNLFTDTGIRAVSKLPKLKTLNITCCANVTKEMKNMLRNSTCIDVADYTAKCTNGNNCTCQIRDRHLEAILDIDVIDLT